MEKTYKLLTPGPLTTSLEVKAAMLRDYSTWDEDYKNICQDIRKKLLDIANLDHDTYTCVFIQGSGTFGVEAMITSLVGKSDKALIISNGKYGERIIEIADRAGLNYIEYKCPYDELPNLDEIEDIIDREDDISHVVMVHLETTTGILNNVKDIGELVKKHKKIFLVDGMSSFGGVEIDFKNIDSLVSSSNKCIEGIPGFSFIFVKKELLESCKGKASTLSLDLYDQYEDMKDGKWRFTSPVHVALAFNQALKEFQE